MFDARMPMSYRLNSVDGATIFQLNTAKFANQQDKLKKLHFYNLPLVFAAGNS